MAAIGACRGANAVARNLVRITPFTVANSPISRRVVEQSDDMVRDGRIKSLLGENRVVPCFVLGAGLDARAVAWQAS